MTYRFYITYWTLFIVSDAVENNIYLNKSAVQCLLNIINFIRRQQENPLR